MNNVEIILNNILCESDIRTRIQNVETFLSFITASYEKKWSNDTSNHLISVLETYLQIVSNRPRYRDTSKRYTLSSFSFLQRLINCLNFYQQYENRAHSACSIYEWCKSMTATNEYDVTVQQSYVDACKQATQSYLSNLISSIDGNDFKNRFVFCKKTGEMLINESHHGIDGFFYSKRFGDVVYCDGKGKCRVCDESDVAKKMILIYLNDVNSKTCNGKHNTKASLLEMEVLHKTNAPVIPFEFTATNINLRSYPIHDSKDDITNINTCKRIFRLHLPSADTPLYIACARYYLHTHHLPSMFEIQSKTYFYYTMLLLLYNLQNGIDSPQKLYNDVASFDLTKLDQTQFLIINYYIFVSSKHEAAKRCAANHLLNIVSLTNSDVRKKIDGDYDLPQFGMYDKSNGCIDITFDDREWNVGDDQQLLFYTHMYYKIIKYFADDVALKEPPESLVKLEHIQRWKNVVSALIKHINSDKHAKTFHRYAQAVTLHIGLIYLRNTRFYAPYQDEIREIYAFLKVDECKKLMKSVYEMMTQITDANHEFSFENFVRIPIPKELNDPRFKCPITLEVYTDPVIAADGFTYERRAIKRYLEENDISPLTRKKMKNRKLFSNKLLRFEIQDITGKILKCESDEESDQESDED